MCFQLSEICNKYYIFTAALTENLFWWLSVICQFKKKLKIFFLMCNVHVSESSSNKSVDVVGGPSRLSASSSSSSDSDSSSSSLSSSSSDSSDSEAG